MHYHRAGNGVTTSPQTQRGCTAFVHNKICRVIGASGIHVGTMSCGKAEGDTSDKNIAYTLQDNEADGPYYRQDFQVQFLPLGENYTSLADGYVAGGKVCGTFLVDGYVAGGTSILAQAKMQDYEAGVIIARGKFLVDGDVAGGTVYTLLGTFLGLVHASTLAFDEPESDMSDKSIAYTSQGNEAGVLSNNIADVSTTHKAMRA